MRDLFAAVMLFAIYSLVSASLFVVLDAGDVALTEAAVGAGISTILMLAVLAMAPRHERSKPTRNLTALAVVIVTGACLVYASLDLPTFGAANNPVHQQVAPYYLEQSYSDIGIPNVVASILASYRSVDTIGEVFVIFTAGIGVLLLLGAARGGKRQSGSGKES